MFQRFFELGLFVGRKFDCCDELATHDALGLVKQFAIPGGNFAQKGEPFLVCQQKAEAAHSLVGLELAQQLVENCLFFLHADHGTFEGQVKSRRGDKHFTKSGKAFAPRTQGFVPILFAQRKDGVGVPACNHGVDQWSTTFLRELAISLSWASALSLLLKAFSAASTISSAMTARTSASTARPSFSAVMRACSTICAA